MTSESNSAIRASYQFECKKDALRQVQDGGVKVTLSINPVDMPASLYSDMMGQRYMAVLVPINEDETPREFTGVKKKSHAGEGKMLAQDDMLGDYFASLGCSSGDDEKDMKDFIGIDSCAELVEGSAAYDEFKEFRSDFYAWRNAKRQADFYGY